MTTAHRQHESSSSPRWAWSLAGILLMAMIGIGLDCAPQQDSTATQPVQQEMAEPVAKQANPAVPTATPQPKTQPKTLPPSAAAVPSEPALPSAPPPPGKARAMWTDKVPLVEDAPEYYVAPNGRADGQGTREDPWDILAGLSGKLPVPAGAVIWLRGGTYVFPWKSFRKKNDRRGFPVRLQGTRERPIHVRACPGERVTLDGGLIVDKGASHVWIWDLEIIVSQNLANWPPKNRKPGSHPGWSDRPLGTVTVLTGPGHKLINLVIHHNTSNGIGLWKTATGAEVHGCLIYRNGWIGPDRNHGHGIYTQNKVGQKQITDNVLFANADQFMSVYGSDAAPVRNYRIMGNLCYAAPKGSRNRLLIGGASDARDIVASENTIHGGALLLGYQPHRDNSGIRAERNTLVRGQLVIRSRKVPALKDNIVWKGDKAGPGKPLVQLRPNRYDPRRANLTVVNWSGAEAVPVDLGSFLRKGEDFRVLSVEDFFGKPVLAGVYQGGEVSLAIPATELMPSREVGGFVVVKGRPGPRLAQR